MKTLSAKLAVGYAALSTITLFGILATGYHLLDRHLERGLELLNQVEAERVQAALAAAPTPVLPSEVQARLQTIAPIGSSGFLLEFSNARDGLLFRSDALAQHALPAGITGGIRVPGIGSLHVSVFDLRGGTLRVATAATEVRQMMTTYAGMSLVLVCVILVASLVTGMLLAQAALKPVRAIQETAHRIRSDNLSMRIPIPPMEGEIASLAQLLNEMFDRLESSFDQIRRFSAETSHELKTPLSLIRLQTEKLMLDDALTPSQQETAQILAEEVEHLGKIIDDLLFLSRTEAQAVRAELRRIDPRQFMEEFAEDARTLAEHRGMRFSLQQSGAGEVEIDPRLLRQVLLNLIANALNASPHGGLVTIESEFTLSAWQVAIEDEGPGVPLADRERIFQRFVRLQAQAPGQAKGTGLGLSICRSLIWLHHGTICAETGPRRQGLRMICLLPVADALPIAPKTMATETE